MKQNQFQTTSEDTGQPRRGLSEAEASNYLGISRSSLRQGRCDGRRLNHMSPPPFVRLGRKIVYLRDDLDCWLESHRTVQEGK